MAAIKAAEGVLREQLESQADDISRLEHQKEKLQQKISKLGALIERADDMLERVKDDVDAHVAEIETAVVEQAERDSRQFIHEEVLRYSQRKRDEFTSTSKQIASHSHSLARNKRYKWCRQASAALYWAWGSVCLAVVRLVPPLDPRPPAIAAKSQ